MAKTLCSQVRGSGFDPWIEIRSHMPQLRVHMMQVKIKKTQHRQINKVSKYEKNCSAVINYRVLESNPCSVITACMSKTKFLSSPSLSFSNGRIGLKIIFSLSCFED